MRHAVLRSLLATLFVVAGAPALSSEQLPGHARAHWLSTDTLVWPGANPTHRFTLHASNEAGISLQGDEVLAERSLALNAASAPDETPWEGPR